MAHPFLVRLEDERGVAGELVDDVLRQIARAHIGDRGGVDHIGRRAAQKTAEEGQARLAGAGAERGEPVGADVGGEAALAGVARSGVVDGDEPRARKPRPQHRLVLGAEPLQLGGQEPHHLALGDRQTQPGQNLHDPFAGHLALKMKHQHEAMQVRAAPADDPRIERGGQRLALRRLAALAPIERRLSLQRQVLNDDLLIALVARARRGLDRQLHRPIDRKFGDAGAAPPRRLVRR